MSLRPSRKISEARRLPIDPRTASRTLTADDQPTFSKLSFTRPPGLSIEGASAPGKVRVALAADSHDALRVDLN
jgi:hypothetical protein